MRKHMLAEWMLAHMLGWSKIHREAHQLEHAISSQVENALLEEHRYPEVCPHGNPFPGHEAAVASWLPLTKTEVGTRGILRRVHEFAEDKGEILAFLEKKGLMPGQEVRVEEVLSFNETVSVRVGEEVVPLGFALARYLFIERVEDESTNSH
jgi:DtxR family Mn-dependent transcriptional regulator